MGGGGGIFFPSILALVIWGFSFFLPFFLIYPAHGFFVLSLFFSVFSVFLNISGFFFLLVWGGGGGFAISIFYFIFYSTLFISPSSTCIAAL